MKKLVLIDGNALLHRAYHATPSFILLSVSSVSGKLCKGEVMKDIKIPKDIFRKYPGKRVAIVEGKAVAASFDAKAAYEQAKAKYPNKQISIFAVPRKEDKYLLV